LIFTVMNPLVDGNKRLGLAATIAFLGVNGRQR
jgi:prophage maintenance system killer protein